MSTSQPNHQVRLADHVRACRVGDQMIFLDLRQSKYIGVGGPQLPSLSAAIFGTRAIDAQELPSNPGLLDESIRRLRSQRLLSDAPDPAPGQRPPALIEPAASLNVEDEDLAADREWRHLARLWRATFTSAAWLRRRSLADIADRVAALPGRSSEHDDGKPTDAMRLAAACYMRLRPFALTSHDRCLHDSLALIHFLAAQRLFPRWVIGVRVHPFGAHSWVQSGGVVLNDLPEFVRRYQPILIV